MKKIIALILVLAVALVAFAACGETASKTTTPAAKTTAPATTPATEPTVEPTAPATEEPATPAVFEKLKDGFTATIEVKDASGAILPVSIAAKIAADFKANAASANLKVLDAEGKATIDLDAAFSKSALVVSEKTLLGEQAIGLALENLAADFAASVFAPTSGSKYALDAATYAQVGALLAELAGGVGQSATQTVADALGVVKAAFAPFVTKGQVQGVDTYTISLTNENLADIVDALAEKLGSFDLSSVASFLPIEAEELNLSALANQLRAVPFTVSGTVSKVAGKVTLDMAESKLVAEYALSTAGATARVYTVAGEATADILTLNVATVGDTTTAVAVYNGNDFAVNATAAVKGDEYTLAIEVTGAGAMKLNLAGKIEITDDYILFTVENFKISQQGMEFSLDLHVSVKVEAAYDVVVPTEYKNVLTMSEAEIDGLVAVISGFIMGE